MSHVVASDRVVASALHLIENPGCKAYCIARAENKAVAEAYDWARQTFPVSERNLQAALRLVLYGAVELSPDGTARVWYHGQRSRPYFVATQSCSCSAFTKTRGFCKHITARDIARYAHELTQQYLADPTQVAMLHRDCPRTLPQ